MNSLRRFPSFLVFLILFLWMSICFSAEDTELTNLIEKGKALTEQKSYPAAIAILETVVTKDPKNAEALDSLLNAYDAYSQKLISQDRFEQAQTYLRKMEEVVQKIDVLPVKEKDFSIGGSKAKSRIDREIARTKAFMSDSAPEGKMDLVSLNAGRERYNEAVLNFNKRQYEIAKTLLEDSVKLDPTNPYAYELLGQIADLNHNLEEAERYYRKSFSLNPDPNLRAKYEKLLREKGIDKDQQQYSDEHFIIRYRRGGAFEGSKIRDYLREAYRTISQEFGFYPKYKIPVLLYDRDEYEKLLGSVPHWSGALYDGKIRLPVYENLDVANLQGDLKKVVEQSMDKNLKKLIHHEVTHAFVLDLTQMKCPTWLNEGLAQYEENKILPINLSVLAAAVKDHSLSSLDELMFEDISKNPSRDKALLFYLESFSFVSYLIEHSRMYNVKQFLVEIGKEVPFADAFEKVFGRSLRDFASEWQLDLEKRYGK